MISQEEKERMSIIYYSALTENFVCFPKLQYSSSTMNSVNSNSDINESNPPSKPLTNRIIVSHCKSLTHADN